MRLFLDGRFGVGQRIQRRVRYGIRYETIGCVLVGYGERRQINELLFELLYIERCAGARGKRVVVVCVGSTVVSVEMAVSVDAVGVASRLSVACAAVGQFNWLSDRTKAVSVIELGTQLGGIDHGAVLARFAVRAGFLKFLRVGIVGEMTAVDSFEYTLAEIFEKRLFGQRGAGRVVRGRVLAVRIVGALRIVVVAAVVVVRAGEALFVVFGKVNRRLAVFALRCVAVTVDQRRGRVLIRAQIIKTL